MSSNIHKLGEFLALVDNRNTDLAITNLQGVSINKEFIPSIANIIGTDLSSYKIVRTGQFAYGPVTSRNGDKISIARLSAEDCIISSSYTPFEVTRPDVLDPEYLMLWFMRPEFDRYARFMSNGSAREVFDWDCMCNVDIPVPPIEEQRKIVRQYKVVTERCRILRQNCSVLTEIAINVYKNECVKKCENSGSLVKKIGDFCPVITGKKDVNCTCENGKYPFFSCSKDTFTTDDYSFDGDAILIAGNGDFNAKYYSGKFEAYQRTYVLIPTDSKIRDYLYYAVLFSLPKATSGARGSVISFITKGIVENLAVHMLNDKKQFELMCTFFSIINTSISDMEKEMSYINKICNGILQRL